MDQFSITAIGRDRPGIVAAISGALLAVGGNLEDSRMANLGGHFAMMLTVQVPSSAGADLERELLRVRDELGLDAVALNPIGDVDAGDAGATHVLTAYGADHPGIVNAVCVELARVGANIFDLKTQVAGSAESPLYMMIIELDLGQGTEAELGEALDEVGSEAAVEISLRGLEAEAL